MRILRVNPDLTVDEIDRDEHDWLPGDGDWDAVAIAGGSHDAYVDDEGLFRPGAVTASIDGNVVPLPAYIVAVRGEDVSDATLGLEEARALIA